MEGRGANGRGPFAPRVALSRPVLDLSHGVQGPPRSYRSRKGARVQPVGQIGPVLPSRLQRSGGVRYPAAPGRR